MKNSSQASLKAVKSLMVDRKTLTLTMQSRPLSAALRTASMF